MQSGAKLKPTYAMLCPSMCDCMEEDIWSTRVLGQLQQQGWDLGLGQPVSHYSWVVPAIVTGESAKKWSLRPGTISENRVKFGQGQQQG